MKTVKYDEAEGTIFNGCPFVSKEFPIITKGLMTGKTITRHTSLCGNHCPHFEYVKAGKKYEDGRDFLYGQKTIDDDLYYIDHYSDFDRIILTCSGSPVVLRVSDGGEK